jgi:hypothetical protein
MTLEAALFSALSVMTGALTWAVNILYARLQHAENSVEALRLKIETLLSENGEYSAQVEMFRQCPMRDRCPFSLHKHEKNQPSNGPVTRP